MPLTNKSHGLGKKVLIETITSNQFVSASSGVFFLQCVFANYYHRKLKNYKARKISVAAVSASFCAFDNFDVSAKHGRSKLSNYKARKIFFLFSFYQFLIFRRR